MFSNYRLSGSYYSFRGDFFSCIKPGRLKLYERVGFNDYRLIIIDISVRVLVGRCGERGGKDQRYSNKTTDRQHQVNQFKSASVEALF